MSVSGGLPVDRHLALIVSYVGTHFCGFQRQPRVRTVQACLEEALGELAGHAVAVRGAGRTDAGVHALGQVVDLDWRAGPGIPAEKFPLALARRLPEDLAVTAGCEVPEGFHARFAAVSKRYRYLFWRDPAESPFWRPYAWHHTGALDVGAMRAAAAMLVGRRDFRCFAGAGRPVEDTTRTMLDCTVWERGPLLGIEVEADGFLYRMVRAIAGTLLEVGRGALAADLERLLATRDRGAAGPSLPARGLCLLRVRYADGIGIPHPPFLDVAATPQ